MDSCVQGRGLAGINIDMLECSSRTRVFIAFVMDGHDISCDGDIDYANEGLPNIGFTAATYKKV